MPVLFDLAAHSLCEHVSFRYLMNDWQHVASIDPFAYG